MDKIDEEISAYAKNIEDIKMEWLSCWDLDRVNEFILKRKNQQIIHNGGLKMITLACRIQSCRDLFGGA